VLLDRSNKKSDIKLSYNNGCRDSCVNQKVRFFEKFALCLRVDFVLVARMSRDIEDSDRLESKVSVVGLTTVDEGVVVS